MKAEINKMSCSCAPVEEILPEFTWCAALNAVDTAMLGVLNAEAQFLWVSDTLASLFSRSPEECVGEYCYALFENNEKLRDWFLAGRIDDPVPLVDSGREKIQCSVRTLENSASANGFMLAAFDVTDAVDKESALCAFKEREKCARLRHECVLEKISHEFRTALMGISGLVEFLKDTRVSVDQQEFVDGLEACVERSVSQLDGYLMEGVEDDRVEHYPDLGAGASKTVAAALPHREEVDAVEGRRILLAEDNVINAKVVCKMLSSGGYVVDVVKNGAEAVARIAESGAAYDLILMDCEMPEMSGYEATARIREDGWRRPIIALTADATARARDRCMESGMDAFITKPVHRAQLCQIISDAFVG